MKKHLPKTVFVAWEEETNDEPFLIAQETRKGLATEGEYRRVGVYRLDRVILTTLVPKDRPAKGA